MLVNKISNINFRENDLSREMNSEDAILMLRDPKASVKFRQSQEYARKADSVDSNPLLHWVTNYTEHTVCWPNRRQIQKVKNLLLR